MTAYDKDFYAELDTTTFATDLTHTRIGYDNLLPDSTVVASTEAAGFPIEALNNSLTYELWKPTTFPAVITIDAGVAKPVGYAAFAAHNLSGCRAVVEYSVDGGVNYEVATTAEFLNNDPAMLLFPEVNAQHWRVTITGWATAPTFFAKFDEQDFGFSTYSATDTGGAYIGVMNLGQALAMERATYGGHAPGTMSRDSIVNGTTSEGGQWLGRSVIRNGFSTNYDFQNLTAAWIRQYFDPFIQHAITKPYFVAWRPSGYANEVLFAATDDKISPVNMGIRDLMSVSWTAKGHGVNG